MVGIKKHFCWKFHWSNQYIHTYIHTGDDMGKQGKTKRQQPSYGGLLVYADFLDDLHFYAN